MHNCSLQHWSKFLFLKDWLNGLYVFYPKIKNFGNDIYSISISNWIFWPWVQFIKHIFLRSKQFYTLTVVMTLDFAVVRFSNALQDYINSSKFISFFPFFSDQWPISLYLTDFLPSIFLNLNFFLFQTVNHCFFPTKKNVHQFDVVQDVCSKKNKLDNFYVWRHNFFKYLTSFLATIPKIL